MFWEHVNDIKGGNLIDPIGEILPAATSPQFMTLARIHPHPRGGNFDGKLLCLEVRWIYKLKATQHSGSNDYVSYISLLEN